MFPHEMIEATDSSGIFSRNKLQGVAVNFSQLQPFKPDSEVFGSVPI